MPEATTQTDTDLWQDMVTTASDWLVMQLDIIWKIALVLLLALLLSRIARKALDRLLRGAIRRGTFQTEADRKKRISTLSRLGSAIIRFVIWIFTGIIIIQLIGLNVAPLLASVSIIGIAVGLGSQKLITDLISGVFIISENQYRVGDQVEIQGVSGVVEDITIRTTVLRNENGDVHHVPNGLIGVTTNHSMGYGHLDIDFYVPAGSDIFVVEHAAMIAGQQLLKGPHGAEIIDPPQFLRAGENRQGTITIKVTGTIVGPNKAEIKKLYFKTLRVELAKHNIKIIKAYQKLTTKLPL